MSSKDSKSFTRKLTSIGLAGVAVALLAIVILLSPNQPLTAQVIAAVGHDPVPPYAHHVYLPVFQTPD